MSSQPSPIIGARDKKSKDAQKPKDNAQKGVVQQNKKIEDLRGEECRRIIREEMRSVIREEMRNMIREEFNEIRQQIQADLEQTIGGLQQRLRDLEEHVNNRDESTEVLFRNAEVILSRSDALSKVVDDMSAEMRQPVLILSGGAVPAPVDATDERGRRLPEDVAPIAVDVVKRALPEVLIEKTDIVSCFRVANTRKLVIKFAASGPHTVRDRLYQGRFELMKKRNVPVNERLFINESLSPRRQEYLTALLDLRKRGRIHTAYSKDGMVFFRPTEHAAAIRVDDASKIRDYMARGQ